MEHIPQSKADVFQNEGVTVQEYSTASETMNLAFIRIDGRYPSSGYTMNTEVDALVQVIEGQGTLTSAHGNEFLIAKGDQLHIEKNEAYCFHGHLELLYAASPKWTPEQAHRIE